LGFDDSIGAFAAHHGHSFATRHDDKGMFDPRLGMGCKLQATMELRICVSIDNRVDIILTISSEVRRTGVRLQPSLRIIATHSENNYSAAVIG